MLILRWTYLNLLHFCSLTFHVPLHCYSHYNAIAIFTFYRIAAEVLTISCFMLCACMKILSMNQDAYRDLISIIKNRQTQQLQNHTRPPYQSTLLPQSQSSIQNPLFSGPFPSHSANQWPPQSSPLQSQYSMQYPPPLPQYQSSIQNPLFSGPSANQWPLQSSPLQSQHSMQYPLLSASLPSHPLPSANQQNLQSIPLPL